MKKNLFLVALCLLLAVLPLTAMAETMYVVTSNGGGVNMRSGPSTDDDVLTGIAYGEPVEVLDVMMGSSWANVSYNGYYGYVMLRYLADHVPPAPNPNPDPYPTYVPAPTVRPTGAPKPTKKPSNNNSLENTLKTMFAGFVNTSYQATVVPSTPTTYVNMRWAPSKVAPVRGQYWAGTVLEVVSETNEWCEVYDASTGQHGFMMKNFLRPAVGGAGSDS